MDAWASAAPSILASGKVSCPQGHYPVVGLEALTLGGSEVTEAIGSTTSSMKGSLPQPNLRGQKHPWKSSV